MNPLKDVVWVGSSKKDLLELPGEVVDEFGHGLYEAQQGKYPRNAKPYHLASGTVIEIVENFDTDTYRAVYTAKFEEAIYVLHCFQKKSTQGRKTSKQDDDLINQRYRNAKELHAQWLTERLKRK